MVQRKSTPEEQLLKLIENPDAAGKKAGAVDSAKPPAFWRSVTAEWTQILSVQNWFGKRKTEAVSPSNAPAEKNKIVYIRKFNGVLLAGVLAAGTYLVMDLSILKSDMSRFLGQVSVNDALYPEGVQIGAEQPNVDYYHRMVNRRNPFLAAPAGPTKEPEKPAPSLSVSEPKSDRMAALMEKVKLVGISWTGNSPLAMIEDSENGRTYFLREGQDINGLKVQQIDKEKVTVTYEGEESTLF